MNFKEKIKYVLIFLLILIDSIYVYGASIPRIIITLLLVSLITLSGVKLDRNAILVGLIFVASLFVGFVKFPDTSVLESKIIYFLICYGIIVSYEWNPNIILKQVYIVSWIVNLFLIVLLVSFMLGMGYENSFLPESNIVIRNNVIGYSSSTLQALSFFLAFNGIYYLKKQSLHTLVPFALGIINVVLSQRRALMIFPIVIILIYMVLYHKRTAVRMLFPIICGMMLLSFILPLFTNMGLGEYLDNIFNLLQFDENSDSIRVKQFYSLVDLFFESPIIGNGIGAYSVSFIRNVDAPYAYELSILSVLTKLGLPAFCYVFYQYFSGLKILANDSNAIPLVLGSLCLFLSNCTNPYLNVSMVLFLIIPFVFSKKTDFDGDFCDSNLL